ncbi:unnamed protein product [Oikopleura dioica]|uniref:RING-type domain-containing protein n=1 Tax=Oikopleura dioica TaxID=34765 RepID=E4WYA7_OIKDI|nr:unnamed protein product [Oikopleura dioica]
MLRSRSFDLGASVAEMFRDSWSNFFGSFAPQQAPSVTINGVPHAHHHHHTSYNSHNSSANRSNNQPSSSSHAQHRPSQHSSSRRNSSNSHQHSSSRNNGFTFGINIDQIMEEVEESINSTIDGFTTNLAFGGRHRPSRSRTSLSSSSSLRNQREPGARTSSNHHHSSVSSQHEHARRRHRADHDRIRREHARSHARRHGQSRQSTEMNRGLSEDQIRKLRKHEFTRQDDECTICMDDFVMSYVVRTLPCKHYFHSDCIDPWLRRNASCPTCRAAVVIPS